MGCGAARPLTCRFAKPPRAGGFLDRQPSGGVFSTNSACCRTRRVMAEAVDDRRTVFQQLRPPAGSDPLPGTPLVARIIRSSLICAARRLGHRVPAPPVIRLPSMKSRAGRASLLVLFAASAHAQAPSMVPATEARPIEVELVSAARSVVPGETTWVAVRLEPNPGWHTYWRYAGDVGSAPSVAWDLPSGWKAGPFIWPAPHRISSPPLASYGYERELFLAAPIEVPRSARVGSTARVAARVTWVVCREECVSEDVDLSIAHTVAATAAIDSAVMRAIVAERRRAPLRQGDWTVRAAVDSSDVIVFA